MKTQRIVIAALLSVFLGVLFAGRSFAQVPECNPFKDDGTVSKTNECVCSDNPQQMNFCMTGTEYLAATMGQMVQKSLYGMAKNLAGIFWLLDRWAAMLADFALRGDVWTQVRDAILEQLQSIMGGSGGVLDQIIRGQGGMLYIAVMLSGFVLILPFAILSGQAPVKIERVIIWGVFVIALFVSGTQGFDLIREIEDLRVGMMQTIIGDETQLADLVAAPMMAQAEEALTIPENEPLALPAAYQQQYFPDLEHAPVWRFRVLVLASHTTLLEVVTAGELITEDAMSEWSVMAISGVIRAGITLVAAYVLLLVALILMMLSAASLVLIIFFVAALPLGFFEFGAVLLGSMAKQYLGVVTVSLFAAVFVRILGEVGATIFGSDFSMGGLVVYTGTLGIVIIALTAGLRSAWKSLSGSTGILHSNFSSIGALAGGGTPIPEIPGKGALNTAVTTAAAVGLGAVTGGVGVALAAGAGQLLSNNKAGRSVAGAVAAVRPDSDASQAFAASALSGGSLPVMAGNMARMRPRDNNRAAGGKGQYSQREMQRGTTAAQVAMGDQDRLRLAPQWRGTQAVGMYLTPDIAALERAEEAFFVQDDRETAETELANAFGDRALAAQILDRYESGGHEAAQQIRGVVERTQAVASDRDGVTSPDGRLDEEYQQERDRLIQNIPGDDVPPGLRSDIADASIRQVIAVQDMPAARQASLLAASVQNPENPSIQVGDTAAQYQLHDLAARRGWSEQQMTTLFEQERKAPPLSSGERQAHIAEQLRAEGFAGERQQDLTEAARLSNLVANTAYIQVPAGGVTASAEIDENAPHHTDDLADDLQSPIIDAAPPAHPEATEPLEEFEQQPSMPQDEKDGHLSDALSHAPGMGTSIPVTDLQDAPPRGAEQSDVPAQIQETPNAPDLNAALFHGSGDAPGDGGTAASPNLENLVRPEPMPPSVKPTRPNQEKGEESA